MQLHKGLVIVVENDKGHIIAMFRDTCEAQKYIDEDPKHRKVGRLANVEVTY